MPNEFLLGSDAAIPNIAGFPFRPLQYVCTSPQYTAAFDFLADLRRHYATVEHDAQHQSINTCGRCVLAFVSFEAKQKHIIEEHSDMQCAA